MASPKRYPTDPVWWRTKLQAGRTVKEPAAELGCSEMTCYRKLRATAPPPESFDSWLARRVQADGPCLRWVGRHGRQGYAQTERNGQTYLLHRLVWEHHWGPIPQGGVVAHSCGHRDCLSTEHLYLSNRSGRAADTVAQGRVAAGEEHWNQRLTWEQVSAIRASRESDDKLAEQYGISRSSIRKIRTWRRWRRPPQRP